MSKQRPFGISRFALLVGLGALWIAAPAAADDSRWQVVGKVGQTSVNGQFGAQGFGWSVDDDDASGSLELGYAVHRYVVLQGGYHDLGSYGRLSRHCPTLCEPDPFGQPIVVPDVPAGVDFRGFSLALVPRWPVTDRLWVRGKIGFLDWRGEVAETSLQEPFVEFEEPSDTDLVAGVGAEFLFDRGVGLLVEYEDSDLASSLSAGASWRF